MKEKLKEFLRGDWISIKEKIKFFFESVYITIDELIEAIAKYL